MSIYGAMFSGVSGLFAQSQALGMISDNISNVNTVGYKGTQARFSTLVTRGATESHYSPGGVRSKPFQTIDRQGLLQGTDSATDLAVSGNGFFVVNAAANPGLGNEFLYTRAGSFNPDAQGNLKNTAGYFLQGWRLNPDGSLANGVNPNVLNGLETVNVANLTGNVRPTTTISLSGRLPANADVISPSPTTTVTLADNLQFSATGGGTATQTVTVYGSNGDPYEVTLSYAQTNPPAAGVITWDQVNVTQVQDADGNTVWSGPPSNLGTLTFDETSGAITGGTATAMDLDAITGLGAFDPISLVTTGLTSNSGTTSITGTANGSANLANTALSKSSPVTIQIYDSLGVPYNLTLRFAKTGSTIGTPSTATWSAYVQDLVDVSTGTRVAGAPTDPSDPGTWGAAIGTVTFDSNGKMIASSNQPTATAGDPMSLSLDMSGFTLANGASWGDGTGPLTIDLGQAQSLSGLTQIDNQASIKSEQDGVQFGEFAGISIDEAGIVTALFDNGTSLKIYQVPLATFPNANGMEARPGNAFLETGRSGAYFLQPPGTGGAGAVASGALEASTVDLATEFTNMIVTQRAYSASAKIITTADEMLDELVRIKR